MHGGTYMQAVRRPEEQDCSKNSEQLRKDAESILRAVLDSGQMQDIVAIFEACVEKASAHEKEQHDLTAVGPSQEKTATNKAEPMETAADVVPKGQTTAAAQGSWPSVSEVVAAKARKETQQKEQRRAMVEELKRQRQVERDQKEAEERQRLKEEEEEDADM